MALIPPRWKANPFSRTARALTFAQGLKQSMNWEKASGELT